MLRSDLTVRVGLALLLMSIASASFAQANESLGVMTQETKNGTVGDNRLMDVNVIGVSDPSQVDMLFKEGDSIVSILEELKAKGFHIQYRAKQFTDEMILLNLPTATDIDGMLNEILEPWHFTSYRTPMGKVVVTPDKNAKKSTASRTDAAAPADREDG
jgi:hypothetical protein